MWPRITTTCTAPYRIEAICVDGVAPSNAADALGVLYATFGEEGLDLAIVYLPPPLDTAVLEPLAEAIRDSGLLTE